MRLSVAGLWRHPRSKVWWFRMGVPERHRAAVGTREWKFSLGETDELRARVKHAEHLAEVRRLIERLETQSALAVGDQADDIVKRGLEVLARRNIGFHAEGGEDFDLARGLDNVLYSMLSVLAFRTRVDWGGKHAAAARLEAFGPEDEDGMPPAQFEPDDPPRLGAGFGSHEHRKAASANIELFEAQPKYQGAAFREVARGLLAARDWRSASFEAQILASAVGHPLPARGALFEAIAECILRRLADHRFQHWPASIDLVLSPMMTAMATHLATETPRSTARESQPDEERTLTALLAMWRDKKGLAEGEQDKTYDEWKLAAERFQELIGTEQVRKITTEQAKRFRALLFKLPSRPKRAIAALPLMDQIEAAKEQNLFTLSAPTVGKHVAAIKSLLAIAKDEGWTLSNAAEGVVVEGAKHQGTERDHFTDEEMRLIYGSPLMTDPDACPDAMFWILFLAPFHGARPGEFCKLKPGEVVEDDDDWVMRIRGDRRRRRAGSAGSEEQRPRRTKTVGSQRDVPVHWIVILGGFLELARIQRERGAEWLFEDLKADRFGDRYRYLSKQINAALRKLGISDVDKAFYSTRHSMKREGRRRGVHEQNLDQIVGHASTNTGRRYGQGVPLSVLKQDVDRLEFRSVDWDPVVDCALERVRRLSDRE